jgi:hypothetical protein
MHKKDILKHFNGKSAYQTKPPESKYEYLDIQHDLVVFFRSHIHLNALEDAEADMESLLFKFCI